MTEVLTRQPDEEKPANDNPPIKGGIFRTITNSHYRVLVAGLITVSFLTMTVPHSYELLSQYEKAETRWLSWFYAFGLEVGAAFAAFIVCDRLVKWWARALAGLMLAGAISGSYLLNLSYYLANGARWEHAIGLAALLPGFIALLGGMLPGLAVNSKLLQSKAEEMHSSADPQPQNAQPVQLIDPLQMMQEAFNSMERNIEQRMAEIDRRVQQQNAQNAQVVEEVVQSLAKLPELVQSQWQNTHISGNGVHSGMPENALNVQSVAKTLEEIGRKLQRRELKIAEFDKAVNDLLINSPLNLEGQATSQ